MESRDFPKISVIIPAYNPGLQLLDCLQSLADMDYPHDHLEVIIIDDCSVDDLAAMVSPRFPQFAVVRRRENGGCDAARDEGIAMASGDIIAHTDSDCVVCPGWADRIVQAVRSGASAVTGPVLHQRGLRAQLIAITQFGHSQARKSGPTGLFPGCNVAMTRESLEELGYRRNDLRDGSDRLLAWRFWKSGRIVAYDPKMLVMHFPPVEVMRLARRFIHYSGATYRLRAAEPELPGGRLLKLGAAAPFLMAAARLCRDYQRLVALSLAGRTPLYLAPPLAALFPLVRTLDAFGMFRAMLDRPR